MMTKSECLSFLNLAENATEAEICHAYEELKKRFLSERFLSGEAGNNAAKNLHMLEEANQILIAEQRDKQNILTFGNSYGEIVELIKNNELDKAQQILDNCTKRDADYHYYQALIYYRRLWYLESKKQLLIAQELDPNNQKYAESLYKLQVEMASPFANPQTINFESRPQNSIPMEDRNSLTRCCMTWCAINCCCNLFYYFFR